MFGESRDASDATHDQWLDGSTLQNRFNCLFLLALLMAVPTANAGSGASWSGVLTDVAGRSLDGAIVEMHSSSGEHQYTERTSADGKFLFTSVAAGSYRVSVTIGGQMYNAVLPFEVPANAPALTSTLQISSGGVLRVSLPTPELTNAVAQSSTQASGGERLSEFGGLQPPAECARLQQIAAAGGRHDD